MRHGGGEEVEEDFKTLAARLRLFFSIAASPYNREPAWAIPMKL
jgi:hypothetical protein